MIDLKARGHEGIGRIHLPQESAAWRQLVIKIIYAFLLDLILRDNFLRSAGIHFNNIWFIS
jgi:hypothetical protein